MPKRLTKQEAIDLAAQGVVCDGKPTAAAWELMEGYSWLADKHAREAKRLYRWADIDDLISEARDELLDAILLLKPDSTNPTSYLWDAIQGRMIDYCEHESEKRLEFNHWQLPDESISFNQQLSRPVHDSEKGMKKKPQPFIGLVGETNDDACNRGRTDTSDAKRRFPNSVSPVAQSDVIAAEQWDQLEAMPNSPTDLQIIKLLREDHTRTCEELADAIGCSKSTVSRRLDAIRERATAWKITETTALKAEQNPAKASDLREG